MHYAEFGEDEVGLCSPSGASGASLVAPMLTKSKHAMLEAAIKEYDQNKWKVIGQKVGKPAKVGHRCVFACLASRD